MRSKNAEFFFYDPKTVPAELKPMLDILGTEYPISGKLKTGLRLEFERIGRKNLGKISLGNDAAKIQYGQISMAARSLGSLLAGTVKNNSEAAEENPFETFGIMLDCSRNAVMTVEHFKKWLMQLSLMGYNMAMLYTEDTYELEGERFFGFMRGAYTKNELKEIDDYAHNLGIEMIPCIQTLGHLEQILKHPAYDNVKDTATVILTNSKETYDFIEKAVRHWLSCFRTRRIHIGMDEAHDMGRGKYMDKFGYKRGFDVFNEHLSKLMEICEKCGAKPMIWSDMYFRMGCKSGEYYEKDTVIPQEVRNNIPKEVELVYWDYYHDSKEFYDDWIERHCNLGFKPIMASGVWTWGLPWHNQNWTEKFGGPCIESCIDKGVKEIFFTMWGDDGAYCDFDSAMSGLAWAAEKAFCGKNPEKARVEKRFEAICGGNYNAKVSVSEIYKDNLNIPRLFLWDDPLLNINTVGMIYRYKKLKKGGVSPFESINLQTDNLNKVYARLKKYVDDRKAGDMRHALLFIKLLAVKLEFAGLLLEAYSRNDKRGLKKVRGMIPELVSLINKFDESFRRMWMSHNKPFGLEVIQIRNAGIIRRFGELETRIGEFLNKETDSIPELDEVIVSINSIMGKGGYKTSPAYHLYNRYRDCATSSCIL